jgi:predicted transcriptional regulator of viral defense system
MPSNKMKKIQELSTKAFFTLDDVTQRFGIERASARVLCSRWVHQGLLIRMKNNLYITEWKWNNLTLPDWCKIANVLQVPSYISLMTALAYYDVTTQVQQAYQESVSLKRSVTYSVREAVFSFVKIQKPYYAGFVKQDGIFIATPEKAFLDAAYLYVFGKYKFDVDSLDFNKLDMKKIKDQLKIYPERTKEVVKRLCGI